MPPVDIPGENSPSTSLPESLPELPPVSRTAMAKSLGVLALAVVGAAGIGGAIGMGIHWANQAAQDTQAVVAGPASDNGTGNKTTVGRETAGGQGQFAPEPGAVSDIAIGSWSSAWLVPSPGLSKAIEPAPPIYGYQLSKDGIKEKVARIAKVFGIETALVDDGYGGYSTDIEGSGGWFSASTNGIGYWSYSQPYLSGGYACEPGFNPGVPEPKPNPDPDSDPTAPASPPLAPEPAPMVVPNSGNGSAKGGGSSPDIGTPGVPDCLPGSDSTPAISVEEARTVVEDVAAALAISDTVQWEFPEPYGNTRIVQLHEVVSGQRTGMIWYFDVGAEKQIISASGHLATPTVIDANPATVSLYEAVERASRQPWVSLIEPIYVGSDLGGGVARSCDGPNCAVEAESTTPSAVIQDGAPSSWSPGAPLPLLVSETIVTGGKLTLRQYYFENDVFLVPAWQVFGKDATMNWAIPALADDAYTQVLAKD